MADTTPVPVRRTFSTADKDRPTQELVILHFLQMVGYPDVANLTEDFEQGFDMVGDVRRGPCWRDRDDGRYQNLISLERLRAANLDYVRRRTSGGRVARTPTSC